MGFVPSDLEVLEETTEHLDDGLTMWQLHASSDARDSGYIAPGSRGLVVTYVSSNSDLRWDHRTHVPALQDADHGATTEETAVQERTARFITIHGAHQAQRVLTWSPDPTTLVSITGSA